MSEIISRRQFDMRQPEHRNDDSSEDFFFNLSQRLAEQAVNSRLTTRWPLQVVARAAMGVVGYLQDILADTGLWRSFIVMCRHLYGRTIPFYQVGDEYVDYELNREDVRFLTWYSLAMNYEELRLLDPMDESVARIADLWYDILDSEYDDAPVPESFNMVKGLELGVPEEQDSIYRFGNWLFMYSYLMSPAYALTLSEIMAEPEMKGADGMKLMERIERSMTEDPTGPLALYLGEWIRLIIEGKIPDDAVTAVDEVIDDTDDDNLRPTSKYYTPFVKATNGSRIAFFPDYESLNAFFVNALGWAKGERHLEQYSESHDFVLLVSPHKGMLLARGVARCIRHPENPLYDAAFARDHAIELLTVRGLCPADLLHYLQREGCLPDACFPGNPDTALVADNFDFIARCYLQLYYRGD